MSIFKITSFRIARRSLRAAILFACLACLGTAHANNSLLSDPASASASKPAPSLTSAKNSSAASSKKESSDKGNHQAVAATKLQVVRVNVTNQSYDFIHPWSKRAAFTHRALGAVISGNRVLVTAELVADSTDIEFEKADSGDKTPAIVEAVDYEANLAILKPVDGNFFKGMKPMELKEAKVGDAASVWQLENTGSLLTTPALVTTVEVSHYPVGNAALPIYRLTSSLQWRESSFTVPVVKDGKLIGLLMRYDTHSQNADIIPTPVIEHFLTAAAKKDYHGFPDAGVYYAPLRNQNLRQYAGLKPAETGGVYVTQVTKHGPADTAGIQVGDVILAINDKPVDQDGNYLDPQYGKLSLLNLISTKSYDGDVLKFKIERNGEPQVLDVKVTNHPPEDYVIEPYIIGKAPKYYVIGGLVFQELSRQYLKEWGADWFKKAPLRFVYMDEFQSELFPDAHRKIVFLSQVLPSEATLGYEDLGGLVVTKINGVPINSIADIDTALKNPVDGFHKIEFDEHPKVIYLDPKEVDAGVDALKKNYGLHDLKNID